MRRPKKLARRGYCELCRVTQPRVNVHHLLYWKAHYTKGIFKKVRNLPCMQVSICVTEHREVHMDRFDPPVISRAEAQHILDRHRNHRCWCFKPFKLTYRMLVT